MGPINRYTQNDINEWTISLARALTSIGIGREDVVQVGYGYGLFSKVELVEPGTIPRSMGKAQRVIDKRKI
ncbi:MAG: hypothetical protein ACNYWM_12385 [Methanosarcinales archaeon]